MSCDGDPGLQPVLGALPLDVNGPGDAASWTSEPKPWPSLKATESF